MTNYNFNGLTSPILPNVYISKVTLEGAPAATNKIAANKKSVIDMHIREEGLKPSKESFGKPKLIVTYDLLVEVEELFDELEMFVSDIFKYINVNVLTLKGGKGKEAFKYYTGQKNSFGTVKYDSYGALLAELSSNPQKPSFSSLKKDEHFKFSHTKVSDILESKISNSISAAGTDPAKVAQTKINFFKQKYQHTMPDGRVIYKLPVRIVQEVEGNVFPNNLAAIATCTLDVSSMAYDFAAQTEFEAGLDIFTEDYVKHGRLATEVIIKGGKPPTKGMVFFVSTNQEDEEHEKKFSNIKGTLWLGGVHKHGERFMAGNEHTDSMHPYLDYVLVDCARVVDYRQIAEIKKQIINFEPSKNFIFGGNYINLQSKVVVADFSDLSCFGNLLSSIDTNRAVKLFFCIDWGKLLKKHCAVPGLLDSFSKIPAALEVFFASQSVPNILSFKIYRKRTDTAHDITKQSEKTLIYDGYPNIYFTGKMGHNFKKTELNIEKDPELLSALVPVRLDYGLPTPTTSAAYAGFLGHAGHYTFTDYDIKNISRGVFQYSLEVEIMDPTLDYFIHEYNILKSGINQLKLYVSLVNGGYNPIGSPIGPVQFFDSHTGQFTQRFLRRLIELGFYNEGGEETASLGSVEAAYKSAGRIISLMQSKGLMQSAFQALNLYTLFKPMTNPFLGSATPDSVNVAYRTLITIADKLKAFIESFSTATIPKTESLTQISKEKALHKSPVAANIPKRKIKVEYEFDDPSEIVSTINSDAGYDYFGEIKNRTSIGIGLKSILDGDINARTIFELREYFPTLQPVNVPSLVDLDPGTGPGSMAGVNFNVTDTAGMYFKVPIGQTHLPKYIVDHTSNNENDYWMVTNNILRYKLNLLGDTNNMNKLGYGVGDNTPGGKSIDAQMERVLKEYQTLAFKGIYFPQATLVDPLMTTDPAASSKKTEGAAATDQPSVHPADLETNPIDISWDTKENNPLPIDLDFEKYNVTLDSIAKIKQIRVPWAENYGQEKLLLSLINGTYIAPSVLETKLGSYNLALKNSIIEKFVYTLYEREGMFFTKQWLKYKLPYHVLALLVNHSPQGKMTLHSNFRYFDTGGSPKLYMATKDFALEDPLQNFDTFEQMVNNKNMFVDKFGQFWFNHVNLGEIQYLAGYKRTKKPPPIKIKISDEEKKKGTAFGSIHPSSQQPSSTTSRYEEVYSSCIKSDVWQPLTHDSLKAHFKNIDDNSVPGEQIHMLCRIVKYKQEIFNSKAYEVLDLPLYDKYFFITSTKQTEGYGYNAYVHGMPSPKTSASHPSLQMKKIIYMGGSSQITMPVNIQKAEETMKIEALAAEAFEDDNE
tara:strand:+ start:53986 stop:57969 length:3984 start_codon:yes stop_codon:yes gene_type:complete